MIKKMLILIILCLCCIGWRNDGGWGGGTVYQRATSAYVERATTNDTISIAESGKTFSINCSGHDYCTMTLPPAVAGANYGFIAEATSETIYIDTGITTDTIRYQTMSAGDKVGINPSATGDSIELISTQNGYWNIRGMKGTWQDSN